MTNYCSPTASRSLGKIAPMSKKGNAGLSPVQVAAATRRNLAHLQRAMYEREILLAIEEAGSSPLVIHLIHGALLSDYFSHCMKVFELHNNAVATFWAIHKARPELEGVLQQLGTSGGELTAVAKKLKHARDKAHFHIDKTRIGDEVDVWGEADLKHGRLGSAVEAAWNALNALQVHEGRPRTSLLPIDRAAIARMVKYIEAQQMPLGFARLEGLVEWDENGPPQQGTGIRYKGVVRAPARQAPELPSIPGKPDSN